MDTKRFLLAIGSTLLILWLYQAWLEYQYPAYYQEQEQEAPASAEQGSGKAAETPEPETETDRTPEGDTSVPQVSESRSTGQQPAVPGQGAPEKGLAVSTDLLDLRFSARSGDPVAAQLKNYHQEDDPDSAPVSILAPSGDRVVVAQSGWVSSTGPGATHREAFKGPDVEEMRLDEGQKELSVTFSRTQEGIEFRKTYRFRRGSYQVPVEYTVINHTDQPWQGHVYGQFRNRGHKAGSWILYDYDGPVVFTGDSMQTFGVGDLAAREDQGFRETDPTGWSGVMSRYFLTAWLPDPEASNTIYARASGPDGYPGFSSPFPQVAPGQEATLNSKLYLGPKEQSILEEAGRNLRRSVDYGILSFLAIPLFEVLQFFHSLVGNYGFAIILVTLLIKVIFFPLFSMSYRAMAKMRTVQPQLQKIRENYGDDRQKMNEEMMRLYREEKVNPLGGCLPILVQIPVFISLYWVLLESVEIRHEPFALWITDLTSQDPFYVLPILMGASMVVQQLMNPAPLDPVQKKVMLALPVVFTVFFMQFPAGLVLYWLSNNLVSIAQQWWIMRKTT